MFAAAQILLTFSMLNNKLVKYYWLTARVRHGTISDLISFGTGPRTKLFEGSQMIIKCLNTIIGIVKVMTRKWILPTSDFVDIEFNHFPDT